MQRVHQHFTLSNFSLSLSLSLGVCVCRRLFSETFSLSNDATDHNGNLSLHFHSFIYAFLDKRAKFHNNNRCCEPESEREKGNPKVTKNDDNKQSQLLECIELGLVYVHSGKYLCCPFYLAREVCILTYRSFSERLNAA